MKGAGASINDNVLVIKTKMMLGQFEVEKLRQKLLKMRKKSGYNSRIL